MQSDLEALSETLGGNEVLYLFIGVGITLLLTAAGWLINSRFEHGKWIRNEKFRIYGEVTRIQFKLLDAISDSIKLGYDLRITSQDIDDLDRDIENFKEKIKKSSTQKDRRENAEILKSIETKSEKLKEKHKGNGEYFRRSKRDMEGCFDQLANIMGEFTIICSPRMLSYLGEIIKIGVPITETVDPEEFSRILQENQKSLKEIWAKVPVAAKIELHIFRWNERLGANLMLNLHDFQSRRKLRKAKKMKQAEA